jgi:hypothetical protein
MVLIIIWTAGEHMQMVTLMRWSRPGICAKDTDKRGSSSSSSVSEAQALVVVREVEADEEQAEDIDENDAPERVLDRAGHHLARVGRLGARLTSSVPANANPAVTKTAMKMNTTTTRSSTRIPHLRSRVYRRH